MASYGLERRTMPNAPDFVISVHALERFEERFPGLWTNDDDIGLLIYNETMDALNDGRVASIAPLEFANNDLDRWVAGKSKIVWVPLKTRGYVLIDGYEGMTVATVLVGKPSSDARRRLYQGARVENKPSGESPEDKEDEQT
jgi:hypothetical protein